MNFPDCSTLTTRIPRARTGVVLSLLLALAGAGCGNDDTSDVDDFVGTWRYLDAQSTVQCPGADPLSQPPDPNKTLARGASAALVDLSPLPLLQSSGVFCDFTFDVAGPVATAQPGQRCALTSLDIFTVDQPDAKKPPKWSFTLNSPTTAEELVQSTIHFSLSGVETSCSWLLTGHLQRVSKD